MSGQWLCGYCLWPLRKGGSERLSNFPSVMVIHNLDLGLFDPQVLYYTWSERSPVLTKVVIQIPTPLLAPIWMTESEPLGVWETPLQGSSTSSVSHTSFQQSIPLSTPAQSQNLNCYRAMNICILYLWISTSISFTWLKNSRWQKVTSKHWEMSLSNSSSLLCSS